MLRAEDGALPNLLLVTVDTLRADHLGTYGYTLPTSPSIDRLAREGVAFDNAYTPVPTTAPALASMLTGLHVDDHQVRENMGQLSDKLFTLGDALSAAGYDTAGFYGNGAIQNGFGQGLGTWEPFHPSYAAADAAGAERALAWLQQARKPWFLWIHFMDPHGPYTSPPERTASFVYPDSAALRRVLPLGERNSGYGLIPRYQAVAGLTRVGDYVRRYDGEIVGTDAEIGRLVAALEQSGELGRTLVVVTADHGESLGEDDYYFQHGRVLNEPSLRIPLVLRHPGLPAGMRIDTPVSLVDLLPSLTAMLGVSIPSAVAGVDFRPLLHGEVLPPRDLIAYTVTRPEVVAIRRDPWKLLGVPRAAAPKPGVFSRLELFEAGQGRETPVPAGEQRELIRTLDPEIRAVARKVAKASAAAAAISVEQRSRLRALGYVE